jgi:hypothetical protein
MTTEVEAATKALNDLMDQREQLISGPRRPQPSRQLK